MHEYRGSHAYEAVDVNVHRDWLSWKIMRATGAFLPATEHQVAIS